jgi:uncharacterized membrane protein
MMQKLFTNFLKGLLFLVPVAVTSYVVYHIFMKIDGLLPLDRLPMKIPGLGFLLTVVLIIIVGFLASNIFFERTVFFLEKVLTRLPFVKLIYFSIKDLTGAFVGEKKSFNRPVAFTLIPGSDVKMLGFVTSESLGFPSAEGHVSVYLPQSYNFSGFMVLVPRQQITLLPPEDSAKVMAFIVSGGVSRGSSQMPQAGAS